MDVIFSCTHFFASSKNLIVGSFLVYLSIFFTLKASIYTFTLIVGSNLSTGFIYCSDLLTLEAVEYALLISFTTVISISSWSSVIGKYFPSLNGL